MLISFNKEMGLENEFIDAQHQMMFLLIKKLDIAIKQKFPPEVIMKILLEIKKFTEFHFLSEENLMYEVQYPLALNHEKIHSALLFQLDVIIAKVNRRQMFPDEMLDMLYKWLSWHVTHEDVKIVDYIKTCGFRQIDEEKFGLYLE